MMMFRNKKHNDIHANKWNGLGGKIILGETPEECIRREVEEESGYEIGGLSYKGFIVFPAFDDIEDWYVFVFSTDDFTGEMIESPEGELAWIDDTEMGNIPLWEGDYIFMKWLDRPQIFSAKFNYHNKRLVDYQVEFY